MKKVFAPIVLILTVTFLFVSIACSADNKGSAVQGHVVGRDGSPLGGVKVVAMLQSGEHKEGYDWLEAKTNPDGRFVLQGLYPGTYYKIVCNGGQCNDQRERIRSLPSGETMKLTKDYVLIYSPFEVSSKGVIKDLRTELEWASVPDITVNYDQAVAYAASLALAGGGWRLPTVDELKDLYESGQRGCGLDRAFKNLHPKAWSSDPKSPSRQWIVRLSRDEVYAELWDRQSAATCDDCRVLPVRSARQR